MFRPHGWAGAYQFQQFIDLVKQLTASGGVTDLYGYRRTRSMWVN
jgi:hypothetical protein